MNISALTPQPLQLEVFRRNRLRYVPEGSGCYVLATFAKDILYIGLASNLQRRMEQHLDDRKKNEPTDQGKVVWFCWLLSNDLNKVERTWMNIFILQHGKLPILNKTYSPTAT